MTVCVKPLNLCFPALLAILCAACGGTASEDAAGPDAQVTTLGSIEVTAQLVEIPTEFPPNKLYDYAYVMKYKVLEVHRGDVPGDDIFVGHYNPLKPRNAVADARVKDIGGNLRAFRAGDIHRMALEAPIDDHYMGGIVNEYFGDDTGTIYWAVWTNPAPSS